MMDMCIVLRKCILIVDPVTRTCNCLSKKLEKRKRVIKIGDARSIKTPTKKWKECGELGRMPHFSSQNAPLRW